MTYTGSKLFQIAILHPNPHAEFKMTVRAKNKVSARAIAVDRLFERFGVGRGGYISGDVVKAGGR